ncbi:MAG TPA: 2-hydroxychromene-2-carboxylate isomerase [Burkholderiaceae bacterium]|nr:2-hydroxychromene-2-carboxylate isomerase [Burkholderiaceae bacterium]
MSAPVIDYYVFAQSPYAYMGHARFCALVERFGATVNVLPMDGAVVFPATGGLPLPKRAPARISYRMDELKRWRDFLGLPMNVQPRFFPVAGNPASLMMLAAATQGQAVALRFMDAVFKAVWERELDIADATVLNQLAGECGLDAEALAAAAAQPDTQARFEAISQQAIAAEVFGAPTYVLDGERFWGQDRLDFLERALTMRAGASAGAPQA